MMLKRFFPLFTVKFSRRIVTLGCISCNCKFNKSVLISSSRTLAKVQKNTKFTEILKENDPDFKSKTKLISEMNFKCDKDAQPFTKLPIRTLLHIYKTTKNDEMKGYCKNRLYFIADAINCPPSILSERLAHRTFIYSLTFEWLNNALSVLLEMGVSGDRILRDLWVFKYHHVTIHERLQKVTDMGVDTLYPWMVRCSEGILKRSISISREAKDILGDTKSTQIYLANRLHTSPDSVEDMCFKIPALKTIRVAKVKSFLDFLLKEGFKVDDIANKPRVLTASQKTVEQRLDKLRKLGLTEINLNVLCRSRKDFKKYCESVESVGNRQNSND